jgi:hypothetical protein
LKLTLSVCEPPKKGVDKPADQLREGHDSVWR